MEIFHSDPDNPSHLPEHQRHLKVRQILVTCRLAEKDGGILTLLGQTDVLSLPSVSVTVHATVIVVSHARDTLGQPLHSEHG